MIAGMGTWPDGLPVHDLTLYVRLGCGHERVARGWRGEEGQTVCCDVCHKLTIMEVVALTDEAPGPWRLSSADVHRAQCPKCRSVLLIEPRDGGWRVYCSEHGDVSPDDFTPPSDAKQGPS